MREAAPIKISTSDAVSAKSLDADKRLEKCSVRVSFAGYLSVLFFLTVAGGFLNYLGYSQIGLVATLSAWTILPALWFFDRIEFDGKSLTRRGGAAFLYKLISSAPPRLKIGDIERIETHSLWTVRSGGRVFYRYSTEVAGEDATFVFASGGKNYRRMVQNLFKKVPEEKLDARSLDLRDFLIEPEELEQKIEALRLPSSDILDNTLPRLRRSVFHRRTNENHTSGDANENYEQRVEELRQAANELRVAGNLAQSVEAFRRALLRQPKNAALLYEFARGLYSYANAVKSADWLRRSLAAFRLAARRGARDAELLTRIGESFLHSGSLGRASKTFRRALEISGENFRAECGLAEVGLQDGKIAHVVHHYQSAMRAAEDTALRRWAREEAHYFALLNDDVDYMETEVSRINLLGSVSRGKRICRRLTFVGLIIVFAGAFFEQNVTALGWAMTMAMTLFWGAFGFAEKVLLPRSAPEIEDED